MSDVWYFAYGSNLSKGRKQNRTGLIRRAVRAKLPDYRLVFNKQGAAGGVYANIRREPGEVVWGVVYLCDSNAMAELDLWEGVMGGHYDRTAITVELEDGSPCNAEVYVAGERYVVEEQSPSKEYLDCILTGANEHQLPGDYIAKIRQLAMAGQRTT
ncbi:MAG: hypothetical protein RLZZ436_3064 [Planctomycetota bacterium]|jgi:gamma-glutamylcyclotransferase (GGCT)/AIG2-like uncharacterized protein YtfP